MPSTASRSGRLREVPYGEEGNGHSDASTLAAAWRKSSHSGGNDTQCVEVADVRPTHAHIALRDSKNPKGPALMVTPASFAALNHRHQGRAPYRLTATS